VKKVRCKKDIATSIKRSRFCLGAIVGLITVMALLTQPSGVLAAEKIYNFAGVVSPSATHVARDFEVDVSDPTDPPTDDSINTLTTNGLPSGTPDLRTGIYGYASDAEASQTQYDAIAASDNIRWRITDPGSGDNACFWMKFEIAEDPVAITQIDVRVEGYQAQLTDKAWLGIWRPGATTAYWKFLEASQQTNDYDYTGTITANLDEYIYANGDLGTLLRFWPKDIPRITTMLL